jgi:hypothetical protein
VHPQAPLAALGGRPRSRPAAALADGMRDRYRRRAACGAPRARRAARMQGPAGRQGCPAPHRPGRPQRRSSAHAAAACHALAGLAAVARARRRPQAAAPRWATRGSCSGARPAPPRRARARPPGAAALLGAGWQDRAPRRGPLRAHLWRAAAEVRRTGLLHRGCVGSPRSPRRGRLRTQHVHTQHVSAGADAGRPLPAPYQRPLPAQALLMPGQGPQPRSRLSCQEFQPAAQRRPQAPAPARPPATAGRVRAWLRRVALAAACTGPGALLGARGSLFSNGTEMH